MRTIEQILDAFTLKTQDGLLLDNTNVPEGQKEIGDCILNRSSPDGKNKIHVMAHTRYGKSIIVGATVAIRAATKQERWAIVAPTKEQAQIIMDYVLFFCINDPMLSQLLTNAKILRAERLTQRRKRDHITFIGIDGTGTGGEVRTFSADNAMGFGAPNIVLDEAGLTNDSEEAKVFRMLGDNPTDYFIMKIGNPWHNNHFNKAFLDSTYHHINIDATRGMREGRLTQSILDEQKSKPHFDILYNNIFPDTAERDKYGYLPMFTHKFIERVQVDADQIIPFGDRLVGADPNDEGSNEGVIASRYANFARIDLATTELDPISIASQVAAIPAHRYFVDMQGVGSGTVRTLELGTETKNKTVAINAGAKITKEDNLPHHEDPKRYANQRAYLFWQLKVWLENGGKLARDPRWAKQLGAIKYKDDEGGAIQIIPKKLLRTEYYNVDDLGAVDALSFTFSPKKPRTVHMPQFENSGGVQPFYPELGV